MSILRDLSFKVKNSNSKMLFNKITADSKATAQYSGNKYNIVAKEGYKENFAIFACIKKIYDTATMGEFKVYKKNSKGKDEVIDNHPALVVLNKPNVYQTKTDLIKTAIIYKYLAGDAPFEKIKVDRGTKIQSISVFRPDKIQINFSGNLNYLYENIKYIGERTYYIEPNNFGLWKEFDPMDQFDGLGRGMPVVTPALKSGDLLNSFMDWNVSLLQNGASPSGIATTSELLDESTFERAKKTFEEKYTGTINAGKPIFLDGGISWIATSHNPRDMEWDKGMDASVRMVCTSLGVDPILIGYNTQSSTYNNKKEAYKGLYTYTVKPLMESFCNFMTNFLELQSDEYVKMDYSHVEVLQEDLNAKYDRVNKSKVLTVNEKRQMLGKDELKGGDIIADNVTIIDGKVYIPMNLQNADEKNDTE